MDYKRQTTVLSVIFVLVGMMFLFPAISEKALARTSATAYSLSCCIYSNLRAHLDAGKFVFGPTGAPPGPGAGVILSWITAGTGFIGGDEKGFVEADVHDHGTVRFYFNNPDSGANTCQTVASDLNLVAKCSITQGADATAKYILCFPNQFSCSLKNPGLALVGPIHLPPLLGPHPPLP